MSDQTLLEKATAEIDTLMITGGDNSDGGDGSDSDPTADNLSNNELVLRIRHMIDTCQHPRKKVKKIGHKLRPKKLLNPRNTPRSAAPIPARTHLASRPRSVSIRSFDSHNNSSSLHCQTSFFHTYTSNLLPQPVSHSFVLVCSGNPRLPNHLAHPRKAQVAPQRTRLC